MSQSPPFENLLGASDHRFAAEAFLSLCEALPQLVWSSNAARRCDYVNRRWLEFTEAPRSDIVGHELDKFIYPADVDLVLGNWKMAAEKNSGYEMECRLRSKIGDGHWFFLRAVPLIADNKVARWFITLTDINDQKKQVRALAKENVQLNDYSENLENQVAIQTRQLRESIKQLEAFSYSLAHDMRAPCRALTNYSQILLRDHASQLADAPRSYLHKIAVAAERLDSFIRDMLVYSRVAHDKMPIDNINVEQVLSDVIISLPEFQPPLIDLSVRLPLFPVTANETLLAQCFTNLLGNACKFVRDGEKPKVTIYNERRGERVRIFIEDNGIGIPAADQERIFNVFERIHHEKVFPGTGVGLSIVRKAVERMGGTIGVESEPGKGSKFWLELNAGSAKV